MTRLESFGWRSAPTPGVARVVSSHGDYYHLVADEAEGEIVARKKKSAFLDRSAARPITGDFVEYRYNPAGESMITAVLPRFSRFERSDPTARRKAQTLAVNFDTLFIMMSMNENFSLPRLERFLALAEDIGEAEAVVVLTKSDLAAGGGARFEVPGNVKSVAISSVTGEGIEELSRYLLPARTVAFIGSSGVGKSTLVNTLAGEEWCAVQEIQEWSGKGRHTTTSRELIKLPSGALVLDTPGVREIGMVGELDEIKVKGVSTHRFRK